MRCGRLLQGFAMISRGMTGLDLLPGDTSRPMQSAAIRTTLTNTGKRPDRAADTLTTPRTGQIEKAPAMGLTVQTRIVCDRPFFRCFFLFCHVSAFQKENPDEHRHVDQGTHCCYRSQPGHVGFMLLQNFFMLLHFVLLGRKRRLQ